MMDAKYTNKAKYYSKYRPTYPNECVEYILSESKLKENSCVADIGAGTGIFTKKIMDKDFTTYAIESNKDMFNELNKLKNDNLITIHTKAEKTKLSNNSIDLITVAQAFHWFDKYEFKQECNRILKENCNIALIWNEVDYNTNTGKHIMNLIEKYTNGNKLYKIDLSNNDSLVEGFFSSSYKKKIFSNNMELTKEQFVGDYLSKSYTPTENSKEYKEYLEDLNLLYDICSKDGLVNIEQNTYVYLGKI